MNPVLVGSIILGYFLILIGVSWFTSRNAQDGDFYNANRQSPWYLVAFGMIGASLSGVTFISVPGEVGNSNFFYFQVVLGYLVGYFVIAKVLLPLYYKLNLVSIYTYLEERFGFWSYKSGAFFFLISRIIGSSFRLFLVAGVLQISFFDAFGLPFWVAVLVTIILIWLYTFRGGIKTIVVTDTLQTTFMIASVIVSILFIQSELNWSFGEMTTSLFSDARSQIFNWDWQSGNNFYKQFFSGAFIAIVMTGLDQDMMQKNLTCRTLGDAQKNVFWFCIILVIVNFLFLSMGLLLFQYSEISGIAIPERTDYLFPELAINHFSTVGAVVFLLGITAAAYSSADSALTALTTSFCVDFLGFSPKNYHRKKNLRKLVHLGFSLVLFVVILIFQAINDRSVITAVFIAAGYTYGPLLGLFTLGIFTKINVKDHLVPWVCLAAPALSYLVNINSEAWFGGYKFGFEILILNGLLTFVGLLLIRRKD
ncbi:sodium:solute symporter [Marinoscillum furvescens]|uniref:Na+/proline symporter n=1 Tax=Marinoscillum furvescens DSM 4134 TaxID=1122208 RepID=A0A3D9L6L0_MARFU|nr:sodium:solute symporter [Marinoscillum furvescens]RED99808.1 Na+/proline symporter [Marinoscillum furvescens DSM 4134]